MVKLLALVKRQAGLDRQAFLDYWRGEHRSLVRALPGLRRACDNLSLVISGREPRIDLVAEAWWESTDHLLAALASPAGKAMRESLARVADASQTVSAVLSERVVVEPPAGGSFVKNFVTVYRRPDRSLEDFDRYWWEEHPKVVTKLAGLRGYVQCPAVRASGLTPALDGVACVWFDSLDALRAVSHSPQMQDVRADERNFLDQPRLVGVVAEEG